MKKIYKINEKQVSIQTAGMFEDFIDIDVCWGVNPHNESHTKGAFKMTYKKIVESMVIQEAHKELKRALVKIDAYSVYNLNWTGARIEWLDSGTDYKGFSVAMPVYNRPYDYIAIGIVTDGGFIKVSHYRKDSDTQLTRF